MAAPGTPSLPGRSGGGLDTATRGSGAREEFVGARPCSNTRNAGSAARRDTQTHLDEDATLRRFFSECEPDQSGRVSVRHLLHTMHMRTDLNLGPEGLRHGDAPMGGEGLQPSPSRGRTPVTDDGRPGEMRGADGAIGRLPLREGDGEVYQTGDGETVDYEGFREMLEAAMTSDEGMEERTVLVPKDAQVEAQTPPTMERNLFLSALANGKLMYHRDDMLVTAKRIVAGGLAGMLAKSVVAPVDRVKILFQVTNEHFTFRKAKKLMGDILALEGPAGLWKGNSATMIRVFPYAGTQFMMFDTLKRWALARKTHRDPQAVQRLSNLESLVSGSIAGAVSALVTYPLDMARARLAVGVAKRVHGHRHSMGVAALITSVVRQDGVRALYRGVTPSLMGIIPYAGIAFSINEQAKHEVVLITGREPEVLHKLGIGAFAGLVAQSCTYPLEVVRRRMQTQGLLDQHSGVGMVFAAAKDSGASLPAFSEKLNIFQTLQVVVKEQGVKGLFKGLSMNWVKGPVGISISFTTFDFLKHKLKIS
ncbi:unnamed protein product [Discosporangium mesarthrocarpum]